MSAYCKKHRTLDKLREIVRGERAGGGGGGARGGGGGSGAGDVRAAPQHARPYLEARGSHTPHAHDIAYVS